MHCRSSKIVGNSYTYDCVLTGFLSTVVLCFTSVCQLGDRGYYSCFLLALVTGESLVVIHNFAL